MLTIDEYIYDKIVHDLPKLITTLEKTECLNKKCKLKIINKLEKIREMLLESINEETT